MSLIQEIDFGTPASKASTQVTLTIDGKRVSVPAGTSIMRAAKAMFSQAIINRTRKPRVAKKQKLDPTPHFMFTQEQRRRSGRDRNRRWDSHIDVSWPSP